MKYKSTFLTFAIMVFLWAGRLPAADEFSPAKTNDTSSQAQGAENPYAAGAIRGQDKKGNGLAKYRVFLLRYISAKDAIRILADANITNVTQLNDANMVVVCAGAEALVKAGGIMDLVDSNEKYVVKVLMPVEEAGLIPRPEEIAAEISASGKPVSIGTFLNLPGGRGYKVIMDVHEGQLIAVAPVSVMEKIVRIIERSREQAGTAEKSDGNTATVFAAEGAREKVEPNALFNELLGSIAEAQKEISKTTVSKTDLKADLGEKSQAGKTEPNQPKTITAKKEARSAEPNSAKEEGRDTKDEKERRSYEPQVIPNANESIDLELPEKLQIVPLLDLVGKYLNLNYVYDEKDVQGKEISLKVQGKIKVGELYPLVESVLKFTGLAMTRKDNLVIIRPIDSATDIDPVLLDDTGGKVRAGDVVVTRIFQLQYIEAASAKAILDNMKVGVVTDLPGGTLMVTGYAFRMSRIEQLIDVIDKPGRPKQFKFRQLKYTTAKTLAPKVKGLVEQLGDITIAISTAQTQTPMPSRIPRRPPTPTPQPTPMPSSETAKSTVYLDADERTNRILMIGQELELAVVNDLIDALDVAQQDLRAIRIYEIQHVDAQEVRKKLEELGIIGESREERNPPRSRITSRTVAGGQQQPGAPPQQAPIPTAASPAGGTSEAELPTEEVQVVVIESTNSLMVNASSEQHALIATIIAYVDSEAIQQAIPYVVYPLQNQPPEHVAEVLEKLIQEVVRDDKGKVQTVIKKTEEDIIVVPDPNTFSLIVYASKKNQDWISSLIKTLDRRRPQVLIDVTLVEVTRTDTFDLELELASKFPVMEPGASMDQVGAILEPFPAKRVTEAFSSPGTGQAQAFYSDRHIQALLNALETKRYGRVLAKPKILVNDGQIGIIKTTDTTNVKIDTVIIPEQGNAQTTTDFRSYDAGITLKIQPNISEGDLLLLLISLERKDFQNKVENAPPDTTASNVDTIVTVPNNKTIILGGLLKLNQSKGGSKVPILGDIPLVGGLFRSTSNEATDSKLYVFVKANILRPEATLTGMSEIETISQRNRAAFERDEDKFQNHQDWPGIKPKPVDPLKVLDAE